MTYIDIKELGQLPDQATAAIRGFVETIRDQRHVVFLVLRDASGRVQVVCDKKQLPAAADLTVESVISVAGKIQLAPQVKLGGREIQCEAMTIHSIAQTPLPIAADSSLDLQIDYRHLSLRSDKAALTMRVQTSMEHAMRTFWANEGFIEIHSPKLMGTASESGAELFKLPYFNDKTAFLAQSPQFYKQMAIAGGLEKVFEIGPVFRANPSFTSRHDTEFTSVDMEVAWVESHEDVMALEERWLAYVLQAVKEKHGEDIARVFGIEVTVPTLPFPRVTLAEARAIAAERGHEIPHKADLDPPAERLLGQWIKERYGHDFVFVTDYPASVRAFYHMRHPEDQELTQSFDLLWRGLEITTGAKREHRPEQLMKQAIERGYDPEPLANYFGFFAHGCPPHGGCGVGLTRMLMVLLGASNVREVTFLYRGPNRLTP